MQTCQNNPIHGRGLSLAMLGAKRWQEFFAVALALVGLAQTLQVRADVVTDWNIHLEKAAKVAAQLPPIEARIALDRSSVRSPPPGASFRPRDCNRRLHASAHARAGRRAFVHTEFSGISLLHLDI